MNDSDIVDELASIIGVDAKGQNLIDNINELLEYISQLEEENIELEENNGKLLEDNDKMRQEIIDIYVDKFE